MTIIAYKDNVMASDRGMWNGSREAPCSFPKITRGSDGSLWALTGKACDSWFLREWVLAGMDQEHPPEFEGEGEDAASVILAKSDGSLWSSKGKWRFSPTAKSGCWGISDASHFCEGAMEAGMSAPDAVALTIRHHLYAAGSPQIERVGCLGESGTTIEVPAGVPVASFARALG